jgi:prepilin-type N-terminal cleavage/methylation domain-containing protein
MTQKGFTLIELLVVVAIIGILAAIGVVAFTGFMSSAKTKAVIHQHNEIVKFIRLEKAKCELGNPTQRLVTAASLNGTMHWTEPQCGDFLNPVHISPNSYKMQQHLIGIGFKNILDPSHTFHNYSGGYCSSEGSEGAGCTEISGTNGIMSVRTIGVDGSPIVDTINFN